jgi:hypothetical protein
MFAKWQKTSLLQLSICVRCGQGTACHWQLNCTQGSERKQRVMSMIPQQHVCTMQVLLTYDDVMFGGAAMSDGAPTPTERPSTPDSIDNSQTACVGGASHPSPLAADAITPTRRIAAAAAEASEAAGSSALSPRSAAAAAADSVVQVRTAVQTLCHCKLM